MVKILESASILPAESKLTKSQLDSQWVGPGGTGNGSKDGRSGLDMGDVCLGDRPPASLQTLGQISFLLSWPCWRKYRGLGGMMGYVSYSLARSPLFIVPGVPREHSPRCTVCLLWGADLRF